MSESEEIRDLRKEIDELRQVLNETSRATNYLASYLAEQSKLIAEHWYRFILWVRPFQVAAYTKPAQIRRLYRRDPAPRLPAIARAASEHCENAGSNGGKGDWDHPARVFLPNIARTRSKK